MSYIPSGGIENGLIIYDNHVYTIINALSGVSGYDINMGTGTMFVDDSQGNVGINNINPNPLYSLVVNGKQHINNTLLVSGGGAEIVINFLNTSSTANNFVTYDSSSGKLYFTSSNILDKYLLVSQTGSMLGDYLLISQTGSMLAPYLLVNQTGSFALTSSNIFKGNQIISGNLVVTSSTVQFPGISPGVGGGYILTYDETTGQIYYTESFSALTPPDLSGYLLISQTGSMLAPYLLVNQTGGFATTGSNIFSGSQIISGGLTVSGSTILLNTIATGSFTGSFTGSLQGTSSWSNSSSQALTASYINLVGNSNILIDYYTQNTGSITINGSIGVQDNGNAIQQANVLNFGDFITASVNSGVATILVSSSILGGVQILDDGSNIGSFFTLNFTDNISVTNSGSGVATITGNIKTADGGLIQNPATLLNFVGDGVSSVTVSGGTASINIPAQSGIEIYDDGSSEGTAYILDFIGANVGFSSGTASISYPNAISGIGIQNESSTVVTNAVALLFSGSGVYVTQSNSNTASIHIPGLEDNVGGVNGNIQYNSGSSLEGATIFNFISSSNQVQLTGSLIVSNSGGSYILSSSGVIFSSSVYTTGSVFFTGLDVTSSLSHILTYNNVIGKVHYTSSEAYEQVKVKYNSNVTSSKIIEFTGSGVSVSFSGNTASINIPSTINQGPTGYIAFYSGSSTQEINPVSSSLQGGMFWDITNKRLGINKVTPEYTLEVSGSLGATTKSFIIPHKTQEGKYLQYGVTEGPEHSVFIRGKSNSDIIELPKEWNWLIHHDTITVNLTSLGEYQELYVKEILDDKIIIGSNKETKNYNYLIFAERKDVPKLKTII